MLRTLFFAALALGACNNTTITQQGKDLGGFIGGDGGGKVDLAFSGQKYGCHGYVACYTDCFNTGGTSAAQCDGQCAPLSATDAPTTFQTALGCGQEYCLNKNNTVTSYKCKLSGSSLVNMDGTAISDTDPGTGQKACGACLGDAVAALFGDACMGTIDCNPSSCSSATNACLNDLP